MAGTNRVEFAKLLVTIRGKAIFIDRRPVFFNGNATEDWFPLLLSSMSGRPSGPSSVTLMINA